jgi:hypothetical protein
MSEIRWYGAAIDHAVYSAGAAQSLAAMLQQPPSAETWFRLAVEQPVIFRIADQHGIAGGDVQQWMSTRATRLEQQNSIPAAFRKSEGHSSAGGAGTDDDVIKSLTLRRGH